MSSVLRRMKDLVVIQAPADDRAVNEYGDEDDIEDVSWTGVESRAFVYPVATSEDETDRETVVQQYDVFLPPDVSITANSRVVLTLRDEEELTCRVVGEPFQYTRLRGGTSHILARVEAVEG